jgi:hypothetical protein
MGTPHDRDGLALDGRRADRIGAARRLTPTGSFHESDPRGTVLERLAAARREDHAIGIGQDTRRELPGDLIEKGMFLSKGIVEAIPSHDEIASVTSGYPCESGARPRRATRAQRASTGCSSSESGETCPGGTAPSQRGWARLGGAHE